MYDEETIANFIDKYVLDLLQTTQDVDTSVSLKAHTDVQLDATLHDALYAGLKHDPKDPFQEWQSNVKLGWLKKKLLGRLEPWTRISGGKLTKPVLRKGRDPLLLTVRTQKRANHVVTLIAGIETLAIEPAELSKELAAAVGASSGVEPIACTNGPTRHQIMIQGLLDQTVIQHLDSRYGVPARLIDNQAAGKKGMHQKMRAPKNGRIHHDC